jgi:hypothetical protein
MSTVSTAQMSTAQMSIPQMSTVKRSTVKRSTVQRSSAPVLLPQVSVPDAAMRPSANAVAAGEDRASWQLTDRGIAVILLIGGVMMAVALAVIGLTAMRVTSADYDTGLRISTQAHH